MNSIASFTLALQQAMTMPFDSKRMIYGGFEVIQEAGGAHQAEAPAGVQEITQVSVQSDVTIYFY